MLVNKSSEPPGGAGVVELRRAFRRGHGADRLDESRAQRNGCDSSSVVQA